MGYTHYSTQTRDYAKAQWQVIRADIATILDHAENVQGVTLANGMGDVRSRPVIDDSHIMFNGSGDDSHETFAVNRIRPPKESWQSAKGREFCKTARKPYDIAVTACLCYLASVAGSHHVTSDGRGADWLAGLEMARQALPRYANQLDIPRDILAADRWCAPWPGLHTERFTFRFCVDGHAYISDAKESVWYQFKSHFEAAEWAQTHIEPVRKFRGWNGQPTTEGGASIFAAYGYFDETRRNALKRQQEAVLRHMLFLTGTNPARAVAPPLYVRPGDMVAMAEPLAYSIADLLKLDCAA